MMINRFRKNILRFLQQLEKLAVYQTVLYFIMLLNSLYNLFVAQTAVKVTEGALWGPWYSMWLCFGVLGPAIALWAKRVNEYGKYGKGAMNAQLTGDVMALGSYAGYICSTLYTTVWGEANYGMGSAIACALLVCMFVLRDARHLLQKDQWVEPCPT